MEGIVADPWADPDQIFSSCRWQAAAILADMNNPPFEIPRREDVDSLFRRSPTLTRHSRVSHTGPGVRGPSEDGRIDEPLIEESAEDEDEDAKLNFACERMLHDSPSSLL